jgi:hypothetical protein
MTPLSCANIIAIESEGFAASSRTPPQSTFCQLTFARHSGEVKIDIFETLPRRVTIRYVSFKSEFIGQVLVKVAASTYILEKHGSENDSFSEVYQDLCPNNREELKLK